MLWLILLSVLTVMLESVSSVRAQYGLELRAIEWLFTLLFTAEYILRLYSVRRPGRYAASFFGLVDLLAVIPTYLSLVVAGTQSLLVIRALRLLRVFRVLKLAKYLGEANFRWDALRASRAKITVFLGTVMAIVLIVAALMYIIEGEETGFTSIPISVYWAIVTMTTVGYGDIAPQTVAGQTLAARADVSRLRHHRRPNWNRFGGAGRPDSAQDQHAGLPVLVPPRGTITMPRTASTAGRNFSFHRQV